MYIVVPNTLTGLPRVYNSLSDLRAELHRLQRHLVDVSLPKFKFDYTSILDSILKEVICYDPFRHIVIIDIDLLLYYLIRFILWHSRTIRNQLTFINTSQNYHLIFYQLGIRQAFEDTASFPGIAHGQLERIKVSKILQCSGIEVNELGSTVYSATGTLRKLTLYIKIKSKSLLL